MDRQYQAFGRMTKSLLLLMLVALTNPTNLAASPIDTMHVFGDSLSDIGNDFILTGSDPVYSVPFGTRYKDGRFANGDVWVDYLANRWNINLRPSLAGFDLAAGDSVNFSYGGSGSQNGDNQTPGGFPVPGVRKQVEVYATALGNAGISADPDALHIVWGGANDYLLPPSLGVNPSPGVVVDNLTGSVDDLYALGARNILVVNLPDLGNTPIARDVFPPGSAANLTAATNAHNQLLSDAVSLLDATLADLELGFLDVHQLFEGIFADPGSYGFSDTQTAGPAAPCLLAASPINCSSIPFDTDQFFWDEQHPTTAVHRLIAQAAVPAPATLMLLLLGFGGLAASKSRRES